jgi:hypothetical protein
MLRTKGIQAIGIVVGRERDSSGEEDALYVFYQFRPDFVVRYTDNSKTQKFYKLPLDSKIPVQYLADNPEINYPVK